MSKDKAESVLFAFQRAHPRGRASHLFCAGWTVTRYAIEGFGEVRSGQCG